MDAPLQGSLLPAALLSTDCELSCREGRGVGPLFPWQVGVWGELIPEGVFHQISFQNISLLAGEHFLGEESMIQEDVERGQGMLEN